MKKILFLSILWHLGFMLCLASSENKLEQANTLYDQEMFLQAAELYEDVLLTEGNAPELYYNLGNAYFKANEIARAILNYERALYIKSDFKDAKYNLEFAKSKTLDEIKEPKKFFLKKWTLNLINSSNSNKWFYISWSSFIISLLLGMLFLFSKKINFRKFTFTVTILALLVMALALTFSIEQKKQMVNHQYAIVMQSVITVRSSPGEGSTSLFELHEGTKVQITRILKDWAEITIADQRIGWIERAHIERI